MTKASDTQVGGSHYKDMGDFQPWDVLQHWLTPEEYRGYQKGVAIAYLARERQKGGDQDIRKAVHHLQRLVEELDHIEATDKAITNPPFAVAEKCCGMPDICNKPCVPRALLQAGADGWITWTGGECPVPPKTRVRYQMRNGPGDTFNDFTGMAGILHWGHDGEPSDIIAYRRASI
jgi:hypothetical protein